MVSTAKSLLDLAVVGGIVLLEYLVWLLPGNVLGPLRVLVGGAFVLFTPGYALTALLFPAREPTVSETDDRRTPGHLSPLERFVCSVGLSLCTVPLLALFLNYTPWGLDSQSVVLSLCAFVTAVTAAAVVRRLLVAPANRVRLPAGEALPRLLGADRVNLVIAVLFVLSLSVAGTALATSEGGQRFSELYLLSEDDETGELVADDYPEALAANASAPLTVGIGNHEGQRTPYTVLVEFHRVAPVEGERTVVSRTEADRLTTTLGAGESARANVSVSPPASASGERLRLTVMLYRGDVGEKPPIPAAYRTVHVWVEVPAPGGVP